MSTGWIYILISPGLHKDLLKIGRTSKTPEDRARELSSATGVPAEYRVAYDVYVQDCIIAEKVIHQRLDSYRYVKNKEFFMLPLKQAIKIVEEIVSQVGDAKDILVKKEYILPEVTEKSKPIEQLQNYVEYKPSRLMRRCGQLERDGYQISFQQVIESPLWRNMNWSTTNDRQYRDGKTGTVNNGKDPIEDKHTTPHNYEEMRLVLGLEKNHSYEENNDSEGAGKTTANIKEGGRKLTQIELMKILSDEYDFTVCKGSRSEGGGIIASKNGKSYNIKFSYSRSYFNYINEEVRCSGWHTLFESEIENSMFQFFVFVVADADNDFHYFIFKSEDILNEFNYKVYDKNKKLHFYFRVKNDGRPVELRETEKDMSNYYNNWDLFSNVS